MQQISREEFVKKYSKESGITVELFYRLGLEVFPCNCGDSICEGWYVLVYWPHNSVSVN